LNSGEMDVIGCSRMSQARHLAPFSPKMTPVFPEDWGRFHLDTQEGD
jgi:hypothetical protein